MCTPLIPALGRKRRKISVNLRLAWSIRASFRTGPKTSQRNPLLKNQNNKAGQWWRTPLISALGRQRQADICELKISLVYKRRASSRRGSKTTEKPCLEKTKKKKKPKKTKNKPKTTTKNTSIKHTLGLLPGLVQLRF